MAARSSDWEVVLDAPSNAVVELTLKLRERNTDWLHKYFQEVSDPRHANYARYLTAEQLERRMAPRDAAVSTVRGWLRGCGLAMAAPHGGGVFARVRGSPRRVNRCLHTRVRLYQSATLKREVWRSLEPYSVPQEVAKHVELITGVHHFPARRRATKSATSPILVGPTDLRTRYNVTDEADPAVNATQAVAEFVSEYFRREDLETFFRKFVPNNVSANVAGVIGPNQNYSSTEASLDIQFLAGVNPLAPSYFYTQASTDFLSDLTAWIALLNDDPKPPLVHSISYGDQNNFPEVSNTYATAFDTAMQKFGTRGLSMIFASGDDGTG